jgi:hypothetical protein
MCVEPARVHIESSLLRVDSTRMRVIVFQTAATCACSLGLCIHCNKVF